LFFFNLIYLYIKKLLFQAVEQLNIKTGNWKDLMNDQPFTRKDIITIQDPNNAMKFNLSTFHHIKNNIRVEDEGRLLTQQIQFNRMSFIVNIRSIL